MVVITSILSLCCLYVCVCVVRVMGTCVCLCVSWVRVCDFINYKLICVQNIRDGACFTVLKLIMGLREPHSDLRARFSR